MRKIVFLVSTIFLMATAPSSWAKENTIGVSGYGTVSYVPNQATYTTGIETEAENAAEAVRQNSEAMENVLAEIKKLGLPDKAVQTSQYTIQPRYEHTRQLNGTQKQVLKGYLVRNTLNLHITDIELLGTLLDSVAQAGANTGGNLSFGTDTYDTLREEARRKAVQDARKKADTLAQEAGVRITGVHSIDEQAMHSPQPPHRAMMMRSAMAESASSVPIRQGEQEVNISVNVVYSFSAE